MTVTKYRVVQTFHVSIKIENGKIMRTIRLLFFFSQSHLFFNRYRTTLGIIIFVVFEIILFEEAFPSNEGRFLFNNVI